MKLLEWLENKFKNFYFVLLFILDLSIATVAIVFLSKEFNYKDKCDSLLCYYILVSIVLSFLNVLFIEDKRNLDTQALITVILSIINISLSVWGGFSLWSCSTKSKDLWFIGLTYFVIQSLTAFVCIMIPLIVFCYFTFIVVSIKNDNKKLNTIA